HSSAASEDIVLNGAQSLLVAGNNVLAIQGLNITANDLDFFLQPELLGVFSAQTPDRYFQPPSPGTNNGTGYSGLVADTKFSVDRGFFDTNLSLSITTATAGAQVFFTTNGGAPTP